MKTTVNNATRRLEEIEHLSARSGLPTPDAAKNRGRNSWTRSLDALLFAVRRYAPPLHWAWAATVAVGFYIYAWLCAPTIRLTTAGAFQWPDCPHPCVFAVWHGCVNSLIVAIAASKPGASLAILIAGDPRGDCLSLLCRLLGLRVVRVTNKGGWKALAELAGEIACGVSVIITADGGGPARIAKVGAVALGMATAKPILSVGADCSPAIRMPHKWDAARTPLPFGRVAVAVLESHQCPECADPASIESSRFGLQQSLDEAAATASKAL